MALVGSTYLIVATNTGLRQGGLISAAALFGWMFLMGIVWTIYGIGWRGETPTWELVEINVDDASDADDGLLFSEVEEAADIVGNDIGAAAVGIDDPDQAQEAALAASKDANLGEWLYLVSSDPVRGEAQAAVDAYLVEEGIFAAGEYVPSQFGAYLIPSKPVLEIDEDANWFAEHWQRLTHTFNESILHPFHGDELIVIQVQGAAAEPTLPGQAPPVATVDPAAPVVSVIMERDRGGPLPSLFSGLRWTPAMFTILCGLVFFALALNLHWRDQAMERVRASAA